MVLYGVIIRATLIKWDYHDNYRVIAEIRTHQSPYGSTEICNTPRDIERLLYRYSYSNREELLLFVENAKGKIQHNMRCDLGVKPGQEIHKIPADLS